MAMGSEFLGQPFLTLVGRKMIDMSEDSKGGTELFELTVREDSSEVVDQVRNGNPTESRKYPNKNPQG